MMMRQERELVVEYGKKLLTERLTNGTAGNISIFDPKTGFMAISPSGVPYMETAPEDIVILDLEGNTVEGYNKPSSEYELHSIFYKHRGDVRAVVHTHSMFATTLACMGEPLRSVHYAIADARVTELPMAPFVPFGTPELAQAAVDHLGNEAKAILLANHGIVCCDETIKGAFALAQTCEWCAEVQWRCMAAGGMNVISDEDMAKTFERYKTYGQPSKDGAHTGGYFG